MSFKGLRKKAFMTFKPVNQQRTTTVVIQEDKKVEFSPVISHEKSTSNISLGQSFILLLYDFDKEIQEQSGTIDLSVYKFV